MLIFRYFNNNHGKGATGYLADETIFIKINAVTAWSGAEPDGEMPANLGIEDDTSPQAILALLRQLVNEAGVPQAEYFHRRSHGRYLEHIIRQVLC